MHFNKALYVLMFVAITYACTYSEPDVAADYISIPLVKLNLALGEHHSSIRQRIPIDTVNFDEDELGIVFFNDYSHHFGAIEFELSGRPIKCHPIVQLFFDSKYQLVKLNAHLGEPSLRLHQPEVQQLLLDAINEQFLALDKQLTKKINEGEYLNNELVNESHYEKIETHQALVRYEIALRNND